MSVEITAEEMLDAFKEDAPPGHVRDTRWAHTHGIGVLGHFVASTVAKKWSAAAFMQGGTVPVICRFSNGSSDPKRHDNWPDTRGLAVKFHPPGGEPHDMLAMTISVFGARSRQEFLDISKAFVPKPIPKKSWFQLNVVDPLHLRLPPPSFPPGVTESGAPGLAAFAGTHPYARAFVLEGGASIVPVSWARIEYHAVHTFMALGPDGVKRPVRFVWQPVDGVFPVPPVELPELGPDFLGEEMRRRLARESARFTLRMTLGEPGDELADPSVNWPKSRRSVNMGMLTIEKMAEPEGVDVSTMSFNPMRLPPGVEPSDDVILHARGEIYSLGCQERGGTGCPVLHGPGARK